LPSRNSSSIWHRWSGENMKMCIFKSEFYAWCFGFLDTFVIAYWLYGSNPQGREAIEALTVHSHRLLSSSSLLKKEKRKRKNLEVISGEGNVNGDVKNNQEVVLESVNEGPDNRKWGKTRNKWSKTQSESVVKWFRKWKREKLVVKKMKTMVN